MIPIADPQISEAAKRGVREVLDSGMIASGDVVERFEEAFAEYVGVDYAVATSSGTTALHAMIAAAGIGEGDAVVTTPFSFVSSANAVVHAGADPVFGDVRADTYNLDPASVRRLLNRRDDVAAILPVHLYGLPADMDALAALAADHDVALLEDAAQAHGATYGGDRVGAIGDAAAFSFYPTKNMTTGEGGMVTTDDPDLAARVRRLINHGRSDSYRHEIVGYNYRMTNIQAAIGVKQVDRLPGRVETRNDHAATLTERLDPVPDIGTPRTPDGRTHAYHQYTVSTPDRSGLCTALDDAGVGYGVYYPRTIPDQPAYDIEATCPTARVASDRVLSLPVHPGLDADEVERVAAAVMSWAEGRE